MMIGGSRQEAPVKRIASVALALALTAAGAAAGPEYTLEDTRSLADPTSPPKKVLVVAMADDPKIRNRIEDKFVSHLRGRGIMATASHPIVPSLTKMEDREKVLAALAKEGVDGVMTVRAVSLTLDKGEKDRWAQNWQTWIESEQTVRQLVEQTLPLPKKKSSNYGIEFTLWGSAGQKLWAARTGITARSDLKSGVSDLLQLTIDAMRDARWV
jgi:hypothetical protein